MTNGSNIGPQQLLFDVYFLNDILTISESCLKII